MNTSLRLFLAALLPLAAFPVPAAAAAKTLADSLNKTELHVLRMGAAPDLEADLNKAATPALLEQYRAEVKKMIDSLPWPASGELTASEVKYLEFRAKEAGKNAQLKGLLGLADGKDKEKTEGMIKSLRAMIKADLGSYDAKTGKTSSDTLGDLLGKYDSKMDLAKAYAAAQAILKGPGEEQAPKCAFADKLSDPAECAVAQALADQPGTGITKDNVGSDAAKRQIQAWTGYYMATQGFKGIENLEPAALKNIGPTLERLEVKDVQLDKYYCDKTFPDGTASAASGSEASQATKALPQLKEWNGKLQAARGADSGEVLKTIADFNKAIAPSNAGRCQAHFNLMKKIGLSPHPQGPGQGLIIKEPKIEADVAAKKEEKKELPLKKMAIGAGAGAIGFGFIGFLLGGPVGALMMGAVGGAFFAGVTYINNS